MSFLSTRKPINPLVLVLIVSAIFFALFIGISSFLFWSKSSSSKHASGVTSGLFSEGSVAVLEVNGVIMDSKKTLQKLEALEEDDTIKAVVLRLNSPGGSVAPSQEIYQAIRNFKKPLVASMSSVAASGAYYIACGAKKIFANAGTITGSIGVIMEFANLEKLYEWAKIQRYVVKTGKFKDMGAEYRPLSAEEHALLQGMVDDVLMQFKQAVSIGRKLSLAQVTAVADGRIFSGNQAKNAKLIDEIGSLQDAVNEAAKEAGIKGQPQVVYPEHSRRKWLDFILDDRSDDGSSDSRSSSSLFESVVHVLTGQRAGLSDLNQAVTGMPAGIYWLWQGSR